VSSDVHRRAAYRLAADGRVARLMRAVPGLESAARRRASRYLGGETRAEALATIERLHAGGLEASVDYFGEAVTDRAIVEATVAEYLELAHALESVRPRVSVWVDLSNVGLDISRDLCRAQLDRIAAALPQGARLRVRAHDSGRMDGILDVALALAASGVAVVATLPANLRRSPADARRLIDARLPVLLVKGASLEPARAAHRWGEETDLAFIRLAHELQAGGVELGIGTHDPVLREAILAGLPGIEVEMLLGVRDEDARELGRRGRRVRVYVPYGTDWPRYWLRRVAAAPTARAALAR
jgi:proline dehydrogenase